MKFLNYLNESEEAIKREAMKRLELIKKDCNPYLNLLKKINYRYYLYSGRRKGYSGTDFSKKQIRQDRNPKDTPDDKHQFIDNWFYENFGIKARSQTLFCTSDTTIARVYGRLYYIFPVGKYEVIWSNKFIDLYNRAYMDWDIERYKELFLNDYAKTYKKGDKINALKSENEIMLYCKEYYMVEAENPINHVFIDTLEMSNEI